MKISKSTQERILSLLGLKLERNSLSYDESKFERYISQEYKHSERFKSDEIYRMFEITLLHPKSGLRIVYTTTESYFGDHVEYKVIDMFIITLAKKRHVIEDVDFIKEVFITSGGAVPFTDVDRAIE